MPSGTAAIIIWILVFIGIFYFLAIRPQRRQKAQHDEMTRMLKKGDEIVTIGGMYGTVTRIGDDWVELEIAKRTRVRFLKRALASITSISEDEEEDEELIEADEDEVVETAEAEELEPVDEEDEEYVEADEDVEEVEVDEEVVETAEEEETPPQAPPAPKV
jgi:preprotein translocase subunit YajC